MVELLFLLSTFAGGLLLGMIFFGGLWWTVNRAVSSEQPALWFFGSLLVRMSIALTGFYLVGREHWERWLLCLLGFVLARIVVKSLTRTSVEDRYTRAPETSYAP